VGTHIYGSRKRTSEAKKFEVVVTTMDRIPLIFAHRGGARRAPENTVLAFRTAIADGAAGFECDVRLTRDQEPVIFHDAQLRRLTGEEGCLRDVTYRELKRMRVLGSDERIPRLEEALGVAREHKCRCYVELKECDPILVDRVIACLDEELRRWVTIVAFTARGDALREVYRRAPEVRIGVLTPVPMMFKRTAERYHASDVSFGWTWRPGAKALFRTIAAMVDVRHAVRKASDQGFEITAGIPNTEKEIREVASYGVAGIFTDDVPLARSVLLGEAEP